MLTLKLSMTQIPSPWNHILDREQVRDRCCKNMIKYELICLFQGVVIMFAFNSLTLYDNALKLVRYSKILIICLETNVYNLQMDSNEKHFHQNFVWLLFVEHTFMDSLLGSLGKLKIRLDSDFMVASYNKSMVQLLV